MKIRTGDSVVLITGKDKGKTGTVLRVLHNKGHIVVSGVNMRTRHIKATPQRAGEKVQYEASIHVSNAMLIDPKTKKRTRIGHSVNEKGGKQRIAKRSKEVLPHKKAGASAAKTEDLKVAGKKDEKKADKKTTAKKATKKEEAPKEAKTPEKKSFWKRAMDFGGDATDEASDLSAEQAGEKDTSKKDA